MGSRQAALDSLDAARDRHPSVAGIVRFFDSAHLPVRLQAVAQPCEVLAGQMLDRLGDSPELTAGLRKLLEAKDCFVRAALDD
jgi:hypothetical protein